MSRTISAAQMGSGTMPYTNPIRYGEPQEAGNVSIGKRFGTNVTVINPEDFTMSQYFQTSGQLFSAGGNTKLEPLLDPLRRKNISIKNLGPGVLFVGHDETTLDPTNGIPLYPHHMNGDSLELPLTYGTFVFVHPSGGDADVRWSEY